MSRPDLIIILTDEERAAPSYENDEIRAWRNEHLPARAWFADNGVSFERHYVASTACVPSRPSLLTGQYPEVHGVTQTDGLGKLHDDTRMRWLRPSEVPTIGNWFRAAGYDTHYDGKWHVSHADLMKNGKPVPTNSGDGHVFPEAVQAYLDADPLGEFGFSGWVGPEPHGADIANTGYIRDPLYADRTVAWLEDRYARRAAGDEEALKPFLLMCCFVNPHDIVLFPRFMRQGKTYPPSIAPPPTIPPSPTDNEDLSSKPALHSAYRDAYYSGYAITPLVKGAYERNAAEYRELYYRFHHDVDGPIDRVRRAVTDNADDAVLVFSADHGDLLGSHGGLHQKWYQLYDEAVRVPFQIARVGAQASVGASIERTPTSHIDLLPTLLGFAGADEAQLAETLTQTHSEVHPLPGRDLSGLVISPGDAPEGQPIYLITRDNMLEGDGSASAMARARGRLEPAFPLQIRIPAHAATNVEGVVVEHEGTLYKIARTFDDPATWTDPHVRHLSVRSPAGPAYRTEPIPDQWELYDLDADPIEAINLAVDPAHTDLLTALQQTLTTTRSEKVHERNTPWPYVQRSDRKTPKMKTPPRPVLRLRKALQKAGMHPDDDVTGVDLSGVAGRRALVVATNHGTLKPGKATGVFGSELTVPYYAFLDAGMEVDVASPRGGDIPFDPTSFRPPIRTTEDDRYLDDPVLQDLCENSLAIGNLDMSTYDIVFFAGGWGAAWDLGRSEAVAAQASAAIANEAVVGGVCHGPLGLLQATNPDGTSFVEGRRLTAVTDRQVKQLGISHTPQHPERELRNAGALYESTRHKRRDAFANHVVVDADLITGQNQNAGPMVAREMMQRVIAKLDGKVGAES
jgi:arylsulfatase A-like enzyme/putative intracellular protease/amidase